MESIEQAQSRLEVTMDGKNGFYRGVLWANHWISVEDDLPDVDKQDTWNHTHSFSKQVITKNDELKFPNYKIQAFIKELNKWQTSDKVTHWRPIERS